MLQLNFTPFPILQTERLLLRQISTEDIPEIFVLRSNDAVNKYLDRPKAQSFDDVRTFIQNINLGIQKNQSILWGIFLKNQPTLIGTICLYNILPENNSAEIGYELIPHFQGKGIMQEVFPKIISFGFDMMKLGIIEAYTTSDNEKSKKLLEKNNFQLSGKLEPDKETSSVVLIYSLDNKPK
ncbi:MAG: GNAT family N-acetyltransferase [Bacteroidetes bacterium]|nr:GNAT family N-acetyltransferase [Bacteroidota bacterium]